MKTYINKCCLILFFFSLCLCTGCKKSVDAGDDFNVWYNDLTRGYELYFNTEGVFRNLYCYEAGYNEKYIIIKTSLISQSKKENNNLIYSYYIIDKTLYKEYWGKPFQEGLIGPLDLPGFTTWKQEIDPDGKLKFDHSFYNDPILGW